MVDIPNERSSHQAVTPRGGGIAIVITWFAGIGYLFLTKQIDSSLFYAFLSGLMLAVVSFLDDIFDLKPYIRLIAQASSASLALFFLGGLNFFGISDHGILFWIINAGAFIGIIWFINLYNFLDGIDAYASLEALAVGAGLLICVNQPFLLLLFVAVAGFLIWNWPTAKIFMGDIGSTQLGFILVVSGIYYNNDLNFSLLNWLILTSVFWVDATLTLFRRWMNREKLSQAHKKHAYQRLVQGGFSHLKVNLFVSIINIILIFSVYFTFKSSIAINLILLCLTIVTLLMMIRIVDSISPFQKH